MRQYTTPEQTAKLIEMGFEKPKSEVKAVEAEGTWDWYENAYSIGELIEMLPKNWTRTKNMEFDGLEWFIDWDSNNSIYQTAAYELIDALYDMIIVMNKKGII